MKWLIDLAAARPLVAAALAAAAGIAAALGATEVADALHTVAAVLGLGPVPGQ